jgi:3-deoxy-7-phosphoheptulonate synthase
MIIVLKPEASESEVDHIIDRLRDLGLKSQISTGQERTIIGVIGDDRILHNQPLTALPGVESVLPIPGSWSAANLRRKRRSSTSGGSKSGRKSWLSWRDLAQSNALNSRWGLHMK